MFEKFTKKWWQGRLVLLLVVVLLIGFLAGIGGEIFARSYIFDYLTGQEMTAELNSKFYELLSKYNFLTKTEKEGPLELVIRRSSATPSLNGTTEVAVGNFLETLKGGTVDFFPATKKSSGDILADSYLEQNKLGRGFILTNDGWLVTTKEVIDSSKKSYLAVNSQGQAYKVEKVVFDPLTSAVFVKVEAKNLSILNFDKTAKVSLGETIFLQNKKGGIKVATIEDNAYYPRVGNYLTEAVSSAEVLDNYYLTKDDLSDIASGEVAVDRNNKIVGLAVAVSGKKLILPLNNFLPVIDSVLRGEKASRIYLGVTYLDLSRLTLNINLYPDYKDINAGALVYKNLEAGAAGVVANSPAAEAGLRVGDVILKVEGEQVSREANLSQLVQNYKLGQEVELTVWQNKEEKQIKVKLGELPVK